MEMQPLARRWRRSSQEALGELSPIEEGEERGGYRGWPCMGFEKYEAKLDIKQPNKGKEWML